MRPVDFSNAYEAIGLHNESEKAPPICRASPITKRPFMDSIPAKPLVGRGEPVGWGKVETALQSLARRLLSLVVGAFVGEVYCVETDAAAASWFLDFEMICGILGFPRH